MDKLNIDFTKQEINFSEKGERKTIPFEHIGIKKKKELDIAETMAKINLYFQTKIYNFANK